jgi:hypothetical protein
MLRWQADEALNSLIRRYYAGEGDLWETIRRQVDDELRHRQIEHGQYHMRFRRRGNAGYDVLIEDASSFAIDA